MIKISSKDIRTKRMAYSSVMQEIKPIKILPVLNVATLHMVAEYLETDFNNVSVYYNSHKKELEEYGIAKISLKNFENAGYTVDPNCPVRNCSFVVNGDVTARVANSGARCMSELAIFNMALGIGHSDVAHKIRSAAALAETESGKKSEVNMSENMTENMVSDMNDITENMDSEPDVEAVATETAADILSFTNVEFGTIRLVEVDGQPWFVGKDVASALGYVDIKHSILDHVDIEDRVNSKTQGHFDPQLGQRGSWLINESGLYFLIMSSKLPTAKKFKRWVTSEVLPSVRKNGGYIAGQEELTEAELMAKAILVAKKALEDREKRIAELSTANRAMSEKINTWDRKSAINALIRTYAARCFGSNFAAAFVDFYRQFDYKYHTKLKSRRDESGKKTGSLMNVMTDKELDNALKLAVAICENNEINAGEVINKVNLAAANPA